MLSCENGLSYFDLFELTGTLHGSYEV